MTAARPTVGDIAAWRRLGTAALVACDVPNSRTAAETLRRAADRAFKSLLPTQDPEQRARFVKLLGFGQAWAALDANARQGNRGPMRMWADECLTWLSVQFPVQLPGASPPGRFRADIDG